MAEGPRDIHDSGFKLLFDHADMVRDLLRGFVPADIVGGFDFASLEPFPTDYVGDGLRQSRSDRVWRVRFRAAGSQEWLYLLLLLEFQSTADRYMAVRVLSYTAQTWLKLIRGGDLMSDGRLPPVLPVVIYNGSPRWSAPLEVREAVAEVGAGLAPFQPRQRYLLLDQGALDVETLPSGNLVSAQVGLGRAPVPDVPAALGRIGALLSEPRHGSLRRAFAEMARQLVSRSRTAGSQAGLVESLRELAQAGDLNAMASTLGERIDEYVEEKIAKGIAERTAERHKQGLAQGLERGREEALERGLRHERAMLSRQAARKFGAGTATRLEALLERIDDPERFVRIGEDVIDCATGAELLARVEGAAGRA